LALQFENGQTSPERQKTQKQLLSKLTDIKKLVS
jgi:hypothetical protein